MGGGDKTVNHSEVRDDVYAQAKRSHLAPQLEAMGVSSLLGLEQAGGTRERPADVLLCRAQDIIVGQGVGLAGWHWILVSFVLKRRAIWQMRPRRR